MFPRRNVIKACALALASFLITAGIVTMCFAPWIYNFTTDAILSLSTKQTFTLWKKNPMPLYLEFYFFNWTNPDDIYTPNIKPHFEQIGPFVFEETKEKVNISWNSNNTITFRHLRYWYFNEDKSYANLSTKLTTINAIAVTAGHMVKDWSYVLRKGFDVTLRSWQTKLSKVTTVGEVLFEGYEDPLIDMSKQLPHISSLIPDFDRFGWFYSRNGSYTFDGTFNMEQSGVNFGATHKWNYNSNMTFYEGQCNKVRGSAGEFYSANRTRDRIGFFSSDLCRYVPMDYEKDENVDGTIGYKYILGDSFFDNGTKVPENKCYCGEKCSPYGALNISACRYGAPGYVSQPHFYGADPYYLDQIEGLNPIKEKHQMFMVIEPTTGIPLHVEARLQLNLLVQPINSVGIFQNIPTFYFPVMWFEQKAEIPTLLHFSLKTLLHLPLILRLVGAVVLILALAWLTFLLQRSLVKKVYWKSSKSKKVLPDVSSPEVKDYELPLLKNKESGAVNQR